MADGGAGEGDGHEKGGSKTIEREEDGVIVSPEAVIPGLVVGVCLFLGALVIAIAMVLSMCQERR